MADFDKLFDTLRDELRGLDGDLYLCHLFVPVAQRDAMLTLYRFYADIARIPFEVSEPMLGAIRLQWWRELLDGLAQRETRGTPVGEALLACPLPDADDARALIDGREAALGEQARDAAGLEAEAAAVGPALLRLSCRLLGGDVDAAPVRQAGTGFELMRLVPPQGDVVAQRADALLDAACRAFNALPWAQRKILLPAFLPVGLARRQARAFPRQKSLLAYQFSLLRMALFGRL